MDINTWMIVVFSLLLGMRLGRWAEQSKMDREEKKEQDKLCPHGYEWDDCSDCNH
jgi:hypothetical protein